MNSTTIILVLAVIGQLTAAVLAMRLNARYRLNPAWVLISAAGLVLAILHITIIMLIAGLTDDMEFSPGISLWTCCLAALLVSVLFLGGVAMIEPLFKQLAQAQTLLRKEKHLLENVVRETENELRLARQIQEHLLPTSPPDVAGLDIAGASVPAEWTGGDYFDFIRLPDESWAIVVADVSGHGLAAAMIMTAIRAFFRGLALTYSDIGRIATLTNGAIANDVDHGRFVTMFMTAINPKSRRLRYTSAGHIGYLCRADGSVLTFRQDRTPLGVVADQNMDAADDDITMEDGDLLLIVSDGIPETTRADETAFGVKRTLDVVQQHREQCAKEIVDNLIAAARTFAGEELQKDDMTAVVVKVGEA